MQPGNKQREVFMHDLNTSEACYEKRPEIDTIY